MGRIFVTELISLDGVMEDPGGAEGYRYGAGKRTFARADTRAVGERVAVLTLERP